MRSGRIDFDAVISVTQDAAQLAYNSWRAGTSPDCKVWEKQKGHPICDIDIAVDIHLKSNLLALLPTAGWLSEETADDPARLSQDLLWVVDPIDGTRDYIRGRNGWCVSVALIQAGRPVFAVMAAPTEQKLWVAKAAAGASCNGETLRASTRRDFAGARVPTDALQAVDRDLSIVEQPNSIAMRMTMVACDRADLVATLRWGNEWDIAAAHLMAQEAGARVSNALGEPIIYNKSKPQDFGLICCAADIHMAAIERLSDRAEAILAA